MAKDSEKIVLDPIHGMIHLDPLAVKIIDTPYFQRLRCIKQLSFADFVYPGATHTRFAHSIGVYHLARQMIKHIKAQPFPEGAEKMSEEDETCICVAALCHDLGHGPFSHAYEEMAEGILGETDGSKLKGKDEGKMTNDEKKKKYMHENISVFLVERMFNDSEDLTDDLGSDPVKSIELIKALIQGKDEVKMTNDEKKKKYMFQIVSNNDTGVDVDKWDYFHRDAKACGLPDRFHYDRALSVARVVEVKGKKGVFELGYRDYDAINFYNMFNTRFTLYRKVYKHKVVTAISLMVKDVFRSVHEANEKPKKDEKIKEVSGSVDEANKEGTMDEKIKEVSGSVDEANKEGTMDEKFKIDLFPIISREKGPHRTKEGQDRTKEGQDSTKEGQDRTKEGQDRAKKGQDDYKYMQLTEDKYLDMDKYLQLRDDVLLKIQDSSTPEYEKARDVIKRINKRKLYKLVDGDIPIKRRKDENVDKIKEKIRDRLKDKGMETDDVDVMVVKINYGQGIGDPVEKLNFYSKKKTEGERMTRDKVSSVLPSVFQECHVRVYEKFSSKEEDKETIEQKLKDICGILNNV